MSVSQLNREDRQHRSYVDSPTRLKQTAQEVVVGNPSDIGGGVLLPDGFEAKSVYAEVSAVAASTQTDITTYTVPVGKIFVLTNVEASGENLAKYSVIINSVTNATKRSWWTAFNVDFVYNRYELAAGDVVKVSVIHERTEVSDFEARIIGIEGDA